MVRHADVKAWAVVSWAGVGAKDAGGEGEMKEVKSMSGIVGRDIMGEYEE
jgi:hypothetical protein